VSERVESSDLDAVAVADPCGWEAAVADPPVRRLVVDPEALRGRGEVDVSGRVCRRGSGHAV
jgi:hypothetical protein